MKKEKQLELIKMTPMELICLGINLLARAFSACYIPKKPVDDSRQMQLDLGVR